MIRYPWVKRYKYLALTFHSSFFACSYCGRFNEWYIRRIHEKTVLRTEVSSEGESDDVVQGLEEHLGKEES
jgi:hypothetical protein